jgi:hypothetical protein
MWSFCINCLEFRMPVVTDSQCVRRRGRWDFYRRAAIAPVCLCFVALFHVFRVYCCDQTPWKGGGFGMFSTVDERTARYVRMYLVTPSGDLPVRVPKSWQKRLTEIQAAPSQAGLDGLAERLATLQWRDPRQQWEAIGLNLAALPPDSAVAGPQLHPANNLTCIPDPPFGMPLDVEPLPDGSALDGAAPDGALAVTAVRLELWRFDFDSKTRMLQGRKHLEATARKTGDL